MRLHLDVTVEDWPLQQPFQITGHIFTSSRLVVVQLSDGTHTGRGEAAGIYYNGDTPERLAAVIETIRPQVENGLTRTQLAALLPAGGARNALDCALWDLESRQTGQPVWQMAGLGAPRALLTTCTVSAGEPGAMAQGALAYRGARAIKLKLLGDGRDDQRVHAVRAACPDVYLAVDANQGFTRASLDALWPALLACGVQLVEQPFPIGADHLLDGYPRPIPIAADESLQTLPDVAGLKGRFDVVNIKLDKSGGLTEALNIARQAKDLGLRVMVGNMTGTSLAMAPAFVLGQICEIVDLDGPLLLAQDRSPGLAYVDGTVTIPVAFWGGITA